ncbi:APC family permease [Tropicibacter oceani]|uniref:Amino acid permease n=1 Tax=Tropicibacter oceani TaxID=3058420 RepID=A0ABY8QFL4_9RHOB|nr:amino acid permease [Tropicibacter oceani]WGW03310.1 amino acid permease [Tropicibacter oceani]
MAEGLKRRIGLGLLTAYGVGVMVGAGIYVLSGAVAGVAGTWAPLSFLLAGLIAAPTALSYAEFSTRHPEAAGEAVYVARGFGRDWLGIAVGLAIVLAGVISAAAVLRGGAGYLLALVDLPVALVVVALGGALTLVAIIGVLESLGLAALFTLIEVVGLALIVWAGASAVPLAGVSGAVPWGGIGAGAVLAFFAFIGFEDIVNMAEEVIAPERTLPRAIVLSLVIASALYALVVWAALRVVPPQALAGSEQPLALVWATATGGSGRFLAAIAVFAALNGVLAQMVMAARVLFGLGKAGGALGVFHHAHPRFGTPVLASLVLGAAVVVGALSLPLAVLAEATSVVLLAVFVLVNAALIAVKRGGSRSAFQVPLAVPCAGLLLSLVALVANFALQG